MSKVFILDTNKQPLNPVHHGRARILLSTGQAAVFKWRPFTLILKYAVETPRIEPLRVKIDPGSKTTGLAVVNDASGEVVAAFHLEHRAQRIADAMKSRISIRRGRRSRSTRYRKARFLNRKASHKKGVKQPCLNSRVCNVETWVKRLMRLCPVTALSMELVKFDTQVMENPEISGVEYQQGELQGYEVKEYLLEKWGRVCVYCGKKDTPLEVEHIVPRSKGGSDRVSNLTIACGPCNIKKGALGIKDFLKGKPGLVASVLAQAKAPLKDAAAVNSTRWELFRRLQSLSLPIECGSGGRTKWNRTKRGLEKTHWIDAACVGASTPERLQTEFVRPLLVKAMGHGTRQVCQTDKYGFPNKEPRKHKSYFGFRTGDLAIGKRKDGTTVMGRLTVQASGSFYIGSSAKKSRVSLTYKRWRVLQHSDGYQVVPILLEVGQSM